MSRPSEFITKVKDRVAEHKTHRERRDLLQRIGELTYAQHTDPAVSYETEIALLVEDIRHLDRIQQLQRRKKIADSDHEQ